jgi:hypothetical protein
MDMAQLLPLVGDFGPMGLMVAYLIWRERTQATERIESEKARIAADMARIEADKALAQSLGALTAVVQRLDR